MEDGEEKIATSLDVCQNDEVLSKEELSTGSDNQCGNPNFINLKPATTDVGGVTPEHLCDHIAACFGCGGHAKVIHNARTEASDVTIPEVVDDLREVDVLCQRPGHVLSHAGWVVELACASLPALLVEDPREAAHALARVVDHRALVSPDLSHLG